MCILYFRVGCDMNVQDSFTFPSHCTNTTIKSAILNGGAKTVRTKIAINWTAARRTRKKTDGDNRCRSVTNDQPKITHSVQQLVQYAAEVIPWLRYYI